MQTTTQNQAGERTQKEISLEFRRKARQAVLGEARRISIGRSSHTASVNSSTRVEIVAGSNEAPHVEGMPYLKTGFSNGRGFSMTLFTPSTMRVVVGENWK